MAVSKRKDTGKWQFSVRYKTLAGEPARERQSGFKTRQEAKDAEAMFLINSKESNTSSNMTIAELCEIYVNTKSKTVTRIENEIYDNVRYTQVSTPSKLVDDYFNFINEIEKEGYEIVRSKNLFNDSDVYKGINSVFKNKDGYHFEMQFNTKEAMDVKDNYSHVLYKESDDPGTTRERKNQIKKELVNLWKSVESPKGINNIKTFDNIAKDK